MKNRYVTDLNSIIKNKCGDNEAVQARGWPWADMRAELGVGPTTIWRGASWAECTTTDSIVLRQPHKTSYPYAIPVLCSYFPWLFQGEPSCIKKYIRSD